MAQCGFALFEGGEADRLDRPDAERFDDGSWLKRLHPLPVVAWKCTNIGQMAFIPFRRSFIASRVARHKAMAAFGSFGAAIVVIESGDREGTTAAS
jgi:hypothetical protein